MSTAVLNKGSPSLDNPRGRRLEVAVGITLGVVVLAVGLRVWGRFRYGGGVNLRASIGDHRFWIVVSDLAILLSTAMAMVLSIVACVAVHWGFGLHTKNLSVTEAHTALEMFFLYQIFYKFGAGISKIATCCLLLAISSQQMKRFNLFCKIMIVYIAGYCFACSVATIFQCQLDVKSNWIHTDNQSHCFPKAPFWYVHAALNILASIIIAALPWWLFYYITYKRKYIIATLMTILSISEIIFGCVRVKGLYISSHSLNDLTFGAVTGVILSQLEVNFGIIAACVPTILKISEDLLSKVFRTITGREHTHTTTNRSGHTKTEIQLATVKSTKDYTRFGEAEDEENDIDSTHSDKGSKVNIVPKDKTQILVQTSFVVDHEKDPREHRESWVPGRETEARTSTNVRANQ